MEHNEIVHCVYFSPAFIPQQIYYLNEWFSHFHQAFFVYNAPKQYLAQAHANVRALKIPDQADFISEALSAKRVVFNNLFEEIAIRLARYPEIVGKGVWIPWGPDLYNRQEYIPDSPQKNYGMAFYRLFISRLHGIAPLVRGDYDVAVSLYKTSAKCIELAPIIYHFESDELDRVIALRTRKDHIAIQVGNSADPSNRHLEIFQWLAKHHDRSIRVYAPLSYGNPEYRDRVIMRGRELFGDSFVPLTAYISHEDYNRHLVSMDVLICNHNRQQAFGNISISLYLGTKVFLRSNVTTWSYLTEKLGCRVFDTKTIPHLSWEELLWMHDETREQNRNHIAVLFDRNWQKSMWQKLYTE